MEHPTTPTQSSTLRICAAGFLALVVAMGIGRFAFTPLLPLMQAAGQLDLAQGAWLATANYLGYFLGAVTVSRLNIDPKALIRWGTALVAVLTAAMGATHQMLPWLVLRFAAGVLSAWVLVGVSAWCLAELAKAGRAHWGGMVYAGVGGGIALAGLLCLGGSAMKLSATDLWWQLGTGAALLCAVTLLLIPRNTRFAAAASAGTSQAGNRRQSQWGLVICYGCFGFGYILPATFLPALARAALDDPAMFGWAWPVFGIAAAVSTVLASTFFARTPRVQLWVVSQFVMATGTMLPAVWPTAAAVMISAALVGGTFMVITMAGLQEARLRAGANPTWLLGQLTAAFAFGQIAGPVSSALLGAAFAHTPEGALQGIRAALLVAAVVLAASAWWLMRAQAAAPSLASSTSGASK